ncbi:hypothetical protein [Actinacidiphila sp. bgisy160]|uniref:hypothetical protein n=1 Tax=Actinacidiphila sp. bgisy160 TaxID=3413796 RepID=UPI003D74FB22
MAALTAVPGRAGVVTTLLPAAAPTVPTPFTRPSRVVGRGPHAAHGVLARRCPTCETRDHALAAAPCWWGAGLAGAAVAGPSAAAAASAAPITATTPHGGPWRPDTDDPRFTLVVMPDTHYLFDGASIHPAPVEASFRKVSG